MHLHRWTKWERVSRKMRRFLYPTGDVEYTQYYLFRKCEHCGLEKYRKVEL